MRALTLLLVVVTSCKQSPKPQNGSGSTSPPTTPTTPTTPTPTPTPGPAYKCTTDADCILACDTKDDCCHNPYCSNVMHEDEAAANRKHNEATCTDKKREDCPTVGSIDPNFVFPTPRCQNGACVAEPGKKRAGSASP